MTKSTKLLLRYRNMLRIHFGYAFTDEENEELKEALTEDGLDYIGEENGEIKFEDAKVSVGTGEKSDKSGAK